MLALVVCLVAVAGCQPQGGVGGGSAAQQDAQAQAEPKHETKPKAETKSKPKRQKHDYPRYHRKSIGSAAYMLKRIKRRPATSSASYQRAYFGDSWSTEYGCTTRQWVLIKESRRGSEAGCRVRHGFWISAYDGRRTRNPSTFDIDHLVPLGEAWVSGASRWTAGTRRRYANDLAYSGTLRAVSASSNRSKGDADPANWLPPRAIHRCKYIGTWIAVKYRWKLTIDPAERRVLASYVKSCGRKSDVPKPRRALVRIATHPVRARPTRRPSSTRGRAHKNYKQRDRRYRTCSEAKAHGLGPYFKGVDREYNWYRDADDDGKVCE